MLPRDSCWTSSNSAEPSPAGLANFLLPSGCYAHARCLRCSSGSPADCRVRATGRGLTWGPEIAVEVVSGSTQKVGEGMAASHAQEVSCERVERHCNGCVVQAVHDVRSSWGSEKESPYARSNSARPKFGARSGQRAVTVTPGIDRCDGIPTHHEDAILRPSHRTRCVIPPPMNHLRGPSATI